MPRLIDVEIKDSILLLRPRDRELGAPQADAMKKIVREWPENDVKAIVINFSIAEYMSSMFLSALIEMVKELGQRKVRMGLCELKPKILEVLKATRLDNIFLIFDGSYEACRAFAEK